jgi:hypothetical protein
MEFDTSDNDLSDYENYDYRDYYKDDDWSQPISLPQKKECIPPLDMKTVFIPIPRIGKGGWGSALTGKGSPPPSPPPTIATEEETVPQKTAWKQFDPSLPPADPWAFLKKRPEPPPLSPRPPQPVSLLNPAPSVQSNKLCKYKDSCRMRRDGNCSMVHSLQQWKPRICRFDENCTKKSVCGYHHSNISIHNYLAAMIKKKDTIYFKNATLYQNYLK